MVWRVGLTAVTLGIKNQWDGAGEGAKGSNDVKKSPQVRTMFMWKLGQELERRRGIGKERNDRPHCREISNWIPEFK